LTSVIIIITVHTTLRIVQSYPTACQQLYDMFITSLSGWSIAIYALETIWH